MPNCKDYLTCAEFQKFPNNCNEILNVRNEDIISPFVKVTFTDSGDVITVGNESYNGTGSAKNSAVIKSFEYGSSSGHKCYLTIHDIEGGAFSLFIKKLVKKAENISNSGLNMLVEYGWVFSSCDGRTGFSGDPSPEVEFLPQNIQSTMSQGKILFEIEGTELFALGEEFRINKNVGSERQPIHLKDAIRQLLSDTEYKPVISDVQFLQAKTDGSGFEELIFEGESEEVIQYGPKLPWLSNNVSKKAAISAWLGQTKSANGRGLVLKWDGRKDGNGKVVVMEDPQPKCGEIIGSSCVGTYIVNGGNCSPVIEFNPKFNWKWQSAANVGATIGANQTKIDQIQGRPECINKHIPGASVEIKTATNDNDERMHGSDAGKKRQEAQVAQQFANILFGEEVSANLVIQGDPRPEYATSYYASLYTLGIVVVNPFNLFSRENDSCPVWLANPPCNSILTSSEWRIRGINHYIIEGKYTTTLNVYLVIGAVEEKL